MTRTCPTARDRADGSSSIAGSSTGGPSAASIFSSFLSPVMFLTAMGLGLGSYVSDSAIDDIGGVSYLVFLAPGLLAATAMQSASFEATFPIMGGLDLDQDLPRDVRDADLAARHRPGQSPLDRRPADPDLDGVHRR